MTLMSDPFQTMFELSREFDQLLSRNGQVRAFAPAADVIVTDDAVNVYLDVPGFAVEDLEIELVDDTLTIRGERRYPYAANGDGKRVWQRLERGFGKFERSVRVPDGLDPDAVTAGMDAGVLTLHISKPEPKRPRRIEIGSGGQQAIEQSSEDRELAGAAA